MKFRVLILLCFFIMSSCYAQDLTDSKALNKLNGIKYLGKINSSKYSIILKNNSLLDVKYNVVVDGEYNSSYTFVFITNNLLQKNDAQYNYSYLLKNIDFYCSVLNISTDDVSKLKTLLSRNKQKFLKGNCVIPVSFMKDYDEVYLSFKNYDDSILVNFFFRRLQ